VFLPTTKEEAEKFGWRELDIVLVTGDAYVDHPSFGVALIGHYLVSKGYKVGVIGQPDWRSDKDITRLGRPRLFFGITAGNVDSMVANYTASMKKRKNDDYSPKGEAGKRPDRATIVYANLARRYFPDVPIVLGGLEASLRRFAHYDWGRTKSESPFWWIARLTCSCTGWVRGQCSTLRGSWKALETLKRVRDSEV
jgi:uncharacterized radical SAM protein YgiQ